MINYVSIGVLLSLLLLAMALFVLIRGLRLPSSYAQRRRQRNELRMQYLDAKDKERELAMEEPAEEGHKKRRS
jgi:biopolymer transport protein ExbB/TolQ